MFLPSNWIRRSILVFGLLAVGIAGVCRNASAAPTPGDTVLSAEQRLHADQLISLFENDTLDLQYDYVEALGDGRGITAGRAGFTTGTGDLLAVVKRYVRRVPDSPLAEFLPRLKELADTEIDSTTGLEGLPDAWKQASDDPIFREIEDEQVNIDDYQPAVSYWRTLGLKTPLSLAVLYDTILQHGNDDDPDGMPALLARTNAETGGSPAKGIDELLWLRAFLLERRATLAHADDVETRKVWAESVGRCDVFWQLLNEGNLNLIGPIRIHSGGYSRTLR